MAATSLTSARHEAPTTTMTTPTTATAPSRTARRRSYRFQPWNVGRWLIWGGFALLLVLAPLLGVRFFAMAWRNHYGAVVAAAAVLVVAALLDGRTPPGWVLISTFALLIITNEQPLRRTVKALQGIQK